MCTVSRFLFRGRQNVRAQRANVRTRRPVFPPRCPPGRFSAGSRGKSCRKRLPSQGSWREAPERLIPRRSGKGSPSRGAGSAQPRLRGCREFATADASGGPIFSVLPEKIGEKRGAGLRLVLPASDFRQAPMVQASFHMIVTLRVFYYAPPDTVGIEFGTSCLRNSCCQ